MYSGKGPITASCEAHAMPPLRLPQLKHVQNTVAFATQRPSLGLNLLTKEQPTAVQIPNLRRAGLTVTQALSIGLSLSARLGIEWYFSPIPPSPVV